MSFFSTNIPVPVVASTTTITLAATSNGTATRVQAGGKLYILSTTLTMNSATTGLGGLDTGALAASTTYYLYFCANSIGTFGLVASTAAPATGPTGFAGRFTTIGQFTTNASTQIVESAFSNAINGQPITYYDIGAANFISSGGVTLGGYTDAGLWTLGSVTPSGTSVHRHTISSPARTYTRFQGRGTDSDAVIEVFATGSAGGGLDFFGGTGTGTSSGTARWLHRFNGSNGGGTANNLTWYSYGTSTEVGSIAYATGAWTFGPGSTAINHLFNGAQVNYTTGSSATTFIHNYTNDGLRAQVGINGTGGKIISTGTTHAYTIAVSSILEFGNTSNQVLGSMSNGGIWTLGPGGGTLVNHVINGKMRLSNNGTGTSYIFRLANGTTGTNRGITHYLNDNESRPYANFNADTSDNAFYDWDFAAGTDKIRVQLSGTTNFSASAAGAVTKTSGSFVINHPDPAKTATHKLRHCFVESPTAGDNIYRFSITAATPGETVDITLPDYWQHLNENPQVWVTPVGHYGAAHGGVNGALTTMSITCQLAGAYNVLLVGTRKDTDAVNWWAPNGVEYLKENEA